LRKNNRRKRGLGSGLVVCLKGNLCKGMTGGGRLLVEAGGTIRNLGGKKSTGGSRKREVGLMRPVLATRARGRNSLRREKRKSELQLEVEREHLGKIRQNEGWGTRER